MSTLLMVGIVLICAGMTDLAIMPALKKKNPVVGNILLFISLATIITGIVLMIVDITLQKDLKILNLSEELLLQAINDEKEKKFCNEKEK